MGKMKTRGKMQSEDCRLQIRGKMREKMAGNTSVGTALVLWTVFFYKGAYAVLPVQYIFRSRECKPIVSLFSLNDHFWRCQLLSPATTVKIAG